MMKRTLTLLCLFSLFTFGMQPAVSHAENFAYVDVNRVLTSSEVAKKARETFQSKLSSKQKEVDSMEAEVRRMREDYEKREKVMKTEARAEAKDKIQSKVRDYQRVVEDYQRDLQQENEKWNKKITDALREIIRDIGKDKGYTAIFGKGQVLFASPSIDITDTVLQRLNERNKDSF